jgi:carboxyl-terminal processing protease
LVPSDFPRVGLRFIFGILALIALLLAVACSVDGDDTGATGDSDDLALVWEAWDALLDNYSNPGSLDRSAAAGGAIERIMELGQIAPYPFLADLGRIRGRLPAAVPADLVDVWRATQIYRRDNPEVQAHEVVQMLIRGLLDGLPDAGAAYLTAEQLPEAQERLERSIEGSYLGIGARVVPQENRILLFPFEDSPAEKAGIEPGDSLLAVSGVPVGDATPSEIGDRIRGEAGTKVRLTLERLSEADPVELDVFRGDVQLPTVASQLIPGGIGYVRVYRFRDNTGQQVFEALEQLHQFDMLALILDLRLNAGGSPDAASEVAAQFLPPGDLFRHVEDREGVRREHRFPEDDGRLSIEDLLIAVMVNEQTIGEAEAVAAALQEAGRATVIGVPTYGEGSDYSFVELSDGSALYLPTARWYTPGGQWIGDSPVQPDIVVEYQEVRTGAGGEKQFNTAYEFLDSQLPLFR